MVVVAGTVLSLPSNDRLAGAGPPPAHSPLPGWATPIVKARSGVLRPCGAGGDVHPPTTRVLGHDDVLALACSPVATGRPPRRAVARWRVG